MWSASRPGESELRRRSIEDAEHGSAADEHRPVTASELRRRSIEDAEHGSAADEHRPVTES